MRIYLDAGHGGKDAGAVKGSRYEKNDVLNLTIKIGQELSLKGVEVYYSRTNDVFETLEDRVKKANNLKADYYLSIHRNAASSTAVGVETWVVNNALDSTLKWAETINNSLAVYYKNRGVKKGMPGNKGDFYINRNSKMVSGLFEVGFISNDSENDIFDKNINEMAQTMANAIVIASGFKPNNETEKTPIVTQPIQPTQPPTDLTPNGNSGAVNVTVKKGKWNIRQTPSNSGKVVKVVSGGTVLQYNGVTNDGWYAIANVGYIHRNGLVI
ncbi:MAG: N-acetylmuramoyl-L-alanine amidase [Oscillospiraceae bacterium]